MTNIVLIVGVVLILLAVIILAVVLVLLYKNKNNQNQKNLQNMQTSQSREEDEGQYKTQLMEEEEQSGGETMMMFQDGPEASSENESLFVLILTDIANSNKVYRCNISANAPVTVGRKLGNGIVIKDDVSMSGSHCEFSSKDKKLYVKDLNSLNGTFIQGEKLRDKVQVENGTEIKIGQNIFRVTLL